MSEIQLHSAFASVPTGTPITFRIPPAGKRDPIFGLTKSWLYLAEAQGRLRILRLRERGKKRGISLVRTSDVLALIEEEAK